MNVYLIIRIISILIAIVAIILLAGMYKFNFTNSDIYVENKTGEFIPYEDSAEGEDVSFNFETVASNLTVPWGTAFLPNGDLLVTERSGFLNHISENGEIKTVSVDDVKDFGEGGLMGIALHPDFEENNFIYLYTTKRGGLGTINSVDRFKYVNGILSNRINIIDNIPGARYHDGGRIAFGPDGYLYISTGDALSPALAQDLNSLAGKILRVTDLGEAVSSNPFNSKIYSLGHRNPQGLTWDTDGNLWAVEHGPSGFDELNKISAGGNYGWPKFKGDDNSLGFVSPVLHSGTGTWAPGSVVFVDDRIFFGGLRGEALYEVRFENGSPIIEEHFKGRFGRIRTVVLSPDGEYLYLTTSNKDGRGTLRDGDDRIIRIGAGFF